MLSLRGITGFLTVFRLPSHTDIFIIIRLYIADQHITLGASFRSAADRPGPLSRCHTAPAVVSQNPLRLSCQLVSRIACRQRHQRVSRRFMSTTRRLRSRDGSERSPNTRHDTSLTGGSVIQFRSGTSRCHSESGCRCSATQCARPRYAKETVGQLPPPTTWALL